MTKIARAAVLACGLAALSAAPARADGGRSGPYPPVGPYAAPYGESSHFQRHRFGFDPDPNIRFEISRTRNWRKG